MFSHAKMKVCAWAVLSKSHVRIKDGYKSTSLRRSTTRATPQIHTEDYTHLYTTHQQQWWIYRHAESSSWTMHFADFLAGSFGGACGVAVGYPLDTVKVRIQTQKQFTGIWQCIVLTIRKEGVHGFFKGMFLPITTISMTSSVVFGTYRNCLQALSYIRKAENTKLDVFMSGLAGGVAQVRFTL